MTTIFSSMRFWKVEENWNWKLLLYETSEKVSRGKHVLPFFKIFIFRFLQCLIFSQFTILSTLTMSRNAIFYHFFPYPSLCHFAISNVRRKTQQNEKHLSHFVWWTHLFQVVGGVSGVKKQQCRCKWNDTRSEQDEEKRNFSHFVDVCELWKTNDERLKSTPGEVEIERNLHFSRLFVLSSSAGKTWRANSSIVDICISLKVLRKLIKIRKEISSEFVDALSSAQLDFFVSFVKKFHFIHSRSSLCCTDFIKYIQ